MATIPDVLLPLREPWFTGEVPPKAENYVRFAAQLLERGGQLHVVRHVSGGAGTIIEERVDAETGEALRGLVAREYFAGANDEGARRPLEEFLAPLGVELKVSKRRVPPAVFEVARRILAALPADHLGHECFRTLEVGGWGHGTAKCSEHDGSLVHMFNFTLKGPVRNFAALLLHETGHARFAILEEREPDLAGQLRACHAEIARLPSGGDSRALMPFAVDYLMGPASRAEETLGDAREFAAEAYVMYVVRGKDLARRIGSIPPGLEAPWRKVYDALKRCFGGVEYE
jgi:hypothetical protein